MILRTQNRPGFTLLEVLLALGISVLLMGALYVSMDMQIRYAQAGRERVADSALARALLNRIAADVSASLTPIRATAGATSSSTSSSSSTSTSSSSSTSSTSTTGTSSTTAATDTGASTTTGSSLNAVTPFNSGVQGEVDRLVVFLAQVPAQSKSDSDPEAGQTTGPDIRRVCYWLAGDHGLARQEVNRGVTADDESNQLPPGVPDEEALVIAPEVVSLEFHYFDGSSWTDSWDGTTVGADGATPIGPPRAVAIVLGIRSPNGKIKNFRHVVAIQAANAQPTSTTPEETTP